MTSPPTSAAIASGLCATRASGEHPASKFWSGISRVSSTFQSSAECSRQPEIHRHRRPHRRQRLRRQLIPTTVFAPPTVDRQILGELASIYPAALDDLQLANVAIRHLAEERVDERRGEIR